MNTLYRCVVCNKGFACSVYGTMHLCAECREDGEDCLLLSINEPFDIHPATCIYCRDNLYEDVEGVPI